MSIKNDADLIKALVKKVSIQDICDVVNQTIRDEGKVARKVLVIYRRVDQMKAEKNRVFCIQLTAILLIMTTIYLLISEDVKASPSQTLVVENNTYATILVLFGVGCREDGCQDKRALIPPQSEITLNDFLYVGRVEVSFKPLCVDSKVKAVWKTYIVNQGGSKIKRKYLKARDFGRSVLYGKPECECRQAIGRWKWDKFGTVVIKSDYSTLHEDTGNTGTWNCSDGKTVVINWTINKENVRDTLDFSDNRTKLKGQNNQNPPIPINATKYLGK